jgi:nicotinate-nucleotide adenylyltransferase
MATDAREALKLDRLIFVPAGAQPFKIDTPPVASGQDRLAMVRLAVADDAKYVVDDAAINRKG